MFFFPKMYLVPKSFYIYSRWVKFCLLSLYMSQMIFQAPHGLAGLAPCRPAFLKRDGMLLFCSSLWLCSRTGLDFGFFFPRGLVMGRRWLLVNSFPHCSSSPSIL